MELFETDSFHYLSNALFCEHISVNQIAEQVGTPVYIYSKRHFVNQYRQFERAFKDVKHSIYFAAKSNFNLNVMKIFADLGSGIDVNSGGELFRALRIGIDPQKLILSGVGKTRDEIRLALETNIKLLKAESIEEIELINKIASDLGMVASIAMRINPDVDAKTHPYISTGLAENKFGIAASKAEEIFEKYSKLENIKFTGIDMHIGSQITSIEPFAEAIEKMANLYKKVKDKGIPLQHFDIGGGMGIKYKNENIFSPETLAQAVNHILLKLDCEIIFEPGRFLTGNGGILVSEILYSKKNNHKNFLIVDAAMTDLMRPSLYKAYHHIQPVTLGKKESMIADIVGPVCESSDFLGKEREIEICQAGDKIAIMTAGAYSMVMASNYNGRRRPPEVIVDGDKFYTTRSRESYEQLLWDEEIVQDLHKLK